MNDNVVIWFCQIVICEKGKPVERPGRKATGLRALCKDRGYDSGDTTG